MRVLPYGEDGAYVDLDVGDALDRAARTHAMATRMRAAFPEADVVAGAGVVAVFGARAEEVRAAASGARDGGDVYTPLTDVYTSRGSAETPPGAAGSHVYTSREHVCTHVVDVVYDGPDLDEIAARGGLSPAEVIALHTGRDHVVEIVGFLPGFAYMGPVHPRVVAPRRPTPRPRIAPGSVAIAGAFTGVYPLASPGGWNLLGRSLGPLPFDPARAEPFLFAPGDRVRFRAVTAEPPPDPSTEGDGPRGAQVKAAHLTRTARAADPLAEPPPRGRAGLELARAAGIATIQDAGRAGLLAKGMPPSGPLDPDLFAAANRAVGNPRGAAAIELLAGALVLRARGPVGVSIDGAPARRLRDGEELHIGEGEDAVRYVAVSGGVDVPIVVGARATMITAKIGGVEGRPLRTGDFLPCGHGSGRGLAEESAAEGVGEPHLRRPPKNETNEPPDVLVDPGPHLDRFPPGALDAFLGAEWRISRLRDRTGVRLEGATVPRSGPDLAAPVPMRRGAVQITTDGTPIVLGPDHPTTGGYPVLAVVRASSLGALARRRPGDAVRFRLGR